MKEFQNSNNYRPIALATIILKLFERVILNSTSTMLSTCDYQFGFKANHGTDMCVFVLKQVVDYYVNHGSPIFSVFIYWFFQGIWQSRSQDSFWKINWT